MESYYENICIIRNDLFISENLKWFKVAKKIESIHTDTEKSRNSFNTTKKDKLPNYLLDEYEL